MIEIIDSAKCCGCGNCALVCPKKCIEIKEDAYGFLLAEVDKIACVDCGACEKACPVINHKNETVLDHEVYIAYAKDEEIRFNGSSGGMFGLISNFLFDKNNGQDFYVYGAAFDEGLQLKLTRADSKQDLQSLYKSKYLQSNLNDKFPEIKKLLDNGKNVMFTATPCQVCALKLFLKKDYENLLTVDFVCHGVPSQGLFDKCKTYVEKKKGVTLKGYQFRAKRKNGSTPHYCKITYLKNGKERSKVMLYTKDPFYLGFQKYITMRDSCYECQFSYSNRCSDITIGDFHQVDEFIKGINRFDGVSVFVTNTQKGKQIWESVKEFLFYHKLDASKLIEEKGFLSGNGNVATDKRKKFLEDLKNKDFEYVVNTHLNTKKEWKKNVYYSLPRFIRKRIKKLMGV